ncbi:DUF1127 domain-containing protein [Xanthobacter sp. 91]|uniref:DUF1127 domain-containing protein n=1 Tax=Xanthobacter sp. 91 TaxID=1117244 RepID=UPI0006892E73|nr:DUF1127 domain-containing protein [Xanthobacter sp. 91]
MMMTYHGETRRTPFAPAGELVAALCLSAVGAAVKGLRQVQTIGRVIERRQVMAEIAHLDDHMLRDIGVTRADVRDAVSAPLFEDPTQLLVVRAKERRAAARLAAWRGYPAD